MSGKRKKRRSGMKTAITIMAVLIVACAVVLLGLYLGNESRVRSSRAESSDTGAVSASDSGGTVSRAESSEAAAASPTESSTSGSDSSEASAVSSSSTASSGAESAVSSERAAAVPGTSSTVPASNGHIVCIDAGHQDHGMRDTEPNAPGSSTMKAKLTSGTQGNYTGVPEYEVNLQVSLKLRDELERRGYTVVMTRTANDVEISNVERAQVANDAGADIFIRIHCNSSTDSSVHGALAYVPSNDNAYLGSGVIGESQRLGTILVENQIAVTGQESRGLLYGDDMTGINWAKMPVTIIEMGFMSNREEDQFLTSEEGQNLIMIGLANGVDSFFEGAD